MAVQVVVFTLGQEEYAMPIEVVREITSLGEVRTIPQAPAYLLGLINIRGMAIPVIDLHVRFGVDQAPLTVGGAEPEKKFNTFALITEIQGSQVGLAVDQVQEVRVLDNIDPPPPLITAQFIGGVVNLQDRIIIQLIPEQILNDDEVHKLKYLIN